MRLSRRIFLYILSAAMSFAVYGAGDESVPGYAGENTKTVTALAATSDTDKERMMLIPGGCAFGVKIYSDGLIVVGMGKIVTDSGEKEPAADAGVRVNDVITEVDGDKVTTAEEFVGKIGGCGGHPVELRIRRGERDLRINVVPEMSSDEGKWQIGLWVRDSTAGIGTVTYVDPDTLGFGGLGHGICDGGSGELVPLSRGSIADVKISSVVRGVSGTPGELKGSFSSGRRGALTANTEYGVFGIYSALPASLEGCAPIEAAHRDEVRDGDATVLCTLGDDGICGYGIKISEINRDDKSSKSFAVTVTDSELIRRTGGIVQGMSGSPIIQDGRLIGAVTHVLISDPTKGYGIFIENMAGNFAG